MTEFDPAAAARRRQYRKPAMRSFGGLTELTRMAVGKNGMADGGGVINMRRTGI